MASTSRYTLVFLAGITCGAILTSIVISRIENEALQTHPPADSVAEQTPPAETGDAHDSSNMVQAPPHVASQYDGDASAKIPDNYRDTIGPASRQPTFAEQYQQFEAEPIDGSWAAAMENGLNNYTAVHGPASGEVFEFVQCRSSYCVVAGYKIEGDERTGASIIGDLARQPWWQGAASAYSSWGREDDQQRFVVLLPRYED